MSSTVQELNRTGKGEGQPVGVALLGFGTVGAAVFRLLTEHADDDTHRIGGSVEVRGIAVSDLARQGRGVREELLTDDARALIARDGVDLVVEVIGGIGYPRALVLDALN